MNGSIPSTDPCPETVLVAQMTDGSFVLMAWPPQEPAAILVGEEAAMLQAALTLAFRGGAGDGQREG